MRTRVLGALVLWLAAETAVGADAPVKVQEAVVPPPVSATATATTEAPLGLRELQEIARRVDPRALIAYAQFEAAQGKKREADWIWFPAFTTTIGAGGPLPEAKLADDGSNINLVTPCTREGISGLFHGCSWGVQVRGEVSAQLPIYTFGKIGAGQSAAAHGVEARAALLERERNLAVQDVARAYWGYQTTRDAQKSIQDIRSRIDEARDTAKRLLAEQSDQVTANDVARLELVGAEIDAQAATALANQRVAEVALKLLAGRMPEEALSVRRQELPPPPESPPATALLEMARRLRPELKAASENVLARRALADLEQAKYWPDLALAGGASFAWTSNADSKSLATPYAANPYNFQAWYLALAVRGTFDLPIKAAKVAQVEAELHEAIALQTGAERLLRLDLERALGDLASARGRAEQYKNAAVIAKKLVVKGALAFDSGLGAASDMMFDTLLYTRSEGERIKAYLDGQTAWAALENAVGGPIEMPPHASNIPQSPKAP